MEKAPNTLDHCGLPAPDPRTLKRGLRLPCFEVPAKRLYFILEGGTVHSFLHGPLLDIPALPALQGMSEVEILAQVAALSVFPVQTMNPFKFQSVLVCCDAESSSFAH